MTRRFHYDAVVAGYLGVDLAPGFPPRGPRRLAEILRPGKLVTVENLGVSLGGAVANTGLALGRFGRRVALMGLVGRDALGDLVLQKLHGQGVSPVIRRTDRAGTACGIVLAPPGMDRMFLEDPGCNGVFTSRDVDLSTVRRSRIFHFGYPTLMERLFANRGRELVRIFSGVKRLGVATSLDMTLPDPDSSAGKADWSAILASTLRFTDIFAPSIEEILWMLEPSVHARLLARVGGGDLPGVVPRRVYRRLGDRLLASGVKVLMIKAGRRGAYLRTGDVGELNAATPLRLRADNWSHRELWAAPLPVNRSRVKNACGAGDCAVAGLLAAILDGLDIERASCCAMRAGRDNLYSADAVSGLSDWERTSGLPRGSGRRGARP